MTDFFKRLLNQPEPPAAPDVPPAEMAAYLRSLDDRQWGRYAFSREPLEGKFTSQQKDAYTAAANAALMTAARNRCVLEVNTSAVYRGFRKDFFPSDAILKEWLVLSGNVVITADAHDTKALTYGFEAVAAKLKELGYTKVQVLGKDGFTPCAL